MTFCDNDMTDYTLRTCGIDRAGVVGIGIISEKENPSTEDLEDPQYWVARLDIADLRYWAIRNTRGQYENAEPIEEEDLQGILVTGANHTATIDVPDVNNNVSFWNTMRGQNWKVCIVTSNELMYYITNPVTFFIRPMVSKDKKSLHYYQLQIKWQSLSMPIILNAPEGIFTGVMPGLTGVGIFDYTFDFTFE